MCSCGRRHIGKPPPPVGNMATRFLRTAAQSVRSFRSVTSSTASTVKPAVQKKNETSSVPPRSQNRPKTHAASNSAGVPSFSRPTAASLNRATVLVTPVAPPARAAENLASTSRRKTGTGIPRPASATAQSKKILGTAMSPVKEGADERLQETDCGAGKENSTPILSPACGIPVSTIRTQRIRPKQVVQRRRALLGNQFIDSRASLPAAGRGAGGRGTAAAKKARSSTSAAMRATGTPRRSTRITPRINGEI
jgi:hypothetical protein